MAAKVRGQASDPPLRFLPEGFTLIELLLVMAIVGILVALIAPALSSAREVARSVHCATNLKQMGVLIHAYETENKYLPPSFIQPNPQQHWTALLTEQSDGLSIEYDLNGQMTGSNLPIFECSDVRLPNTGPQTRKTHYSVHRVLMPSQFNGPGWTGSLKMLDLIGRPSEVILIADGVQSNQPNVHGNAGNARPTFIRSIQPVTAFDPNDNDNNAPIAEANNDNTDTNANEQHIRYRHMRDTAGNFVFIDGHVQAIQRGGVLNRNIRTGHQ